MNTLKIGGRLYSFDERTCVAHLDDEVDCSGDCTEEHCECAKGLDRIPMRFEVCGNCEGRGLTSRHVDPDGGWTQEDIADDPDTFERYMNGEYDRSCDACQGKRVFPVVDWDRLPKDVAKRLEKDEWDDAMYEQECAAERRMGA